MGLKGKKAPEGLHGLKRFRVRGVA
jgi:hypothetical protein